MSCIYTTLIQQQGNQKKTIKSTIQSNTVAAQLLSCVQLFVTPQSSRLLCPWDFPSKNTGVHGHFLLQGIEPASLVSPAWQVDSLPLSHLGSPNKRGQKAHGLINMDKTSSLQSAYFTLSVIFVVHKYKVRYSFRFTGFERKIKSLAGATNGKSSLMMTILFYSRIPAASDKPRGQLETVTALGFCLPKSAVRVSGCHTPGEMSADQGGAHSSRQLTEKH